MGVSYDSQCMQLGHVKFRYGCSSLYQLFNETCLEQWKYAGILHLFQSPCSQNSRQRLRILFQVAYKVLSQFKNKQNWHQCKNKQNTLQIGI